MIVNIDGKDIEGSRVIISNFEGEYSPRSYGPIFRHVMSDNKKDIWYEFEDKKKVEEIDVPKEIQFVTPKGFYSKEIALVVGDHILDYDKRYYGWSFVEKKWGNQLVDLVDVDCVLIPCKREDLKRGDWAFWSEICNSMFELDLPKINHYCMILNEDTIVETNSDESGVGESNRSHMNWFKIVQKEMEE